MELPRRKRSSTRRSIQTHAPPPKMNCSSSLQSHWGGRIDKNEKTSFTMKCILLSARRTEQRKKCGQIAWEQVAEMSRFSCNADALRAHSHHSENAKSRKWKNNIKKPAAAADRDGAYKWQHTEKPFVSIGVALANLIDSKDARRCHRSGVRLWFCAMRRLF